MKVFMTGATGFIGQALVAHLLQIGHELTAWVRDDRRAKELLGDDVTLVPATAAGLCDGVTQAEAIINLAGEPILPGRWTAARKGRIETSRVGLAQDMVTVIEGAEQRPRVLISASAIGIYGDRGDALVDEDSAPGGDWLAGVCQRWEAAALAAESLDVRVMVARIGLVLGQQGGVQGTLGPLFRLGLGGRLGSGKQAMSWIHLEDVVAILTAALEDPRWTGPINLVAPEPVSNRVFTSTLAEVLNRPAVLPAPELALRAMLGEAASVLLGGQMVLPSRLRDLDYRWQHPELAAALRA